MTIARAFVEYMETVLSLGTFGTDIFIGSAPLSAPDETWWVVVGGGNNAIKAQSGEKVKNYVLNVFYRNLDAEDVDEAILAFERSINSADCPTLTGYNVVEFEATGFGSDQDIDSEDRTVGLVEVTLTVYD